MTTSALTLTSFLLARIAEDEAAAREVSDDISRIGGDTGPAWSARGRRLYLASVISVLDSRESMVAHIARHDPARVLAECEAKRRIVEFHKSWPVLVETQPEFEPVASGDVDSMTFRMSKQVAWTTEQKYREQFGTEPPSSPIIRALAAVYADHPDYDESWRP